MFNLRRGVKHSAGGTPLSYSQIFVWQIRSTAPLFQHFTLSLELLLDPRAASHNFHFRFFVECVWVINILLANDRPDDYGWMNKHLSAENKEKKKQRKKNQSKNLILILIQGKKITSLARKPAKTVIENIASERVILVPKSLFFI